MFVSKLNREYFFTLRIKDKKDKCFYISKWKSDEEVKSRQRNSLFYFYFHFISH